MDDAAGWIIVLGVCFITFRYFTSGSSSDPINQSNASSNSARSIRPVAQASIEQVSSMFPHINPTAIRWDLQGNGGNIESTVERCLRDGRLPEPPVNFFAGSNSAPISNPQTQSSSTNTRAFPANSSASSGMPSTIPAPSLISRLGLASRLMANEGTHAQSSPGVDQPTSDMEGKGKAKAKSTASVWETSAEAREKSLKERKARMVLEARRKLLEKEKIRSGPMES